MLSHTHKCREDDKKLANLYKATKTCKLFSTKETNLSRDGFSDWSKLSKTLRTHDNSLDHTQSMLKWRELEMCLKNKKSIDHQEWTLLEAERKRWRDVLMQLVSITISLACRSLAFRGSSKCIYEANNGNFLKEVELHALSDPVMENHLSRVKDKNIAHITLDNKSKMSWYSS